MVKKYILLASTAVFISTPYSTLAMEEEHNSSLKGLHKKVEEAASSSLPSLTLEETSPSLQTIRKNLIDSKIPLLERIQKYNPSTLLEQWNGDLKALSPVSTTKEPLIKDLLLKSIWSVGFTYAMTESFFVEQAVVFFDTLLNITRSSQSKNSTCVKPKKSSKGNKRLASSQQASSSNTQDGEKPFQKFLHSITNGEQREILNTLKTFLDNFNDKLNSRISKRKNDIQSLMSLLQKFFKEDFKVLQSEFEIFKKEMEKEKKITLRQPVTTSAELTKISLPAFHGSILEEAVTQDSNFFDLGIQFRAYEALAICIKRGSSYLKQGNYADAELWLRKAAAQKAPLAMFYLGKIADEQQNIENALLWFRKVAEILENDKINKTLYRRTLYSLVCIEDTVKSYETFIELIKAETEKCTRIQFMIANYKLAHLYESGGDFEKVVECCKNYEKALTVVDTGLEGQYKETRTMLHTQLAILLQMIGKREGEKIYYKKILKLNVGAEGKHLKIDALYRLSSMTENLDEKKKYYQQLSDLAETGSVYADANYKLGIIAYRQEEFPSAKTYFQAAYEQGEKEAIIPLAKIEEKGGNYEEAGRLYAKAITLDLKDAMIYYMAFLYQQQRLKEAEVWSEFYTENAAALPEDEILGDNGDSSLESEKKFQVKDIKTSSERAIISPQDPDQATSSAWSNTAIEEDNSVPTLPKSYLRQLARAEKERMNLNREFKEERQAPKTYEDVEVKVIPNAKADVINQSHKIKNLISSLANGEKRGRVEKLSCDNLYSMHLSEKDRLIFKITLGNIETGIKALTIFSATGHYKNNSPKRLSNLNKLTVAPLAVDWSES